MPILNYTTGVDATKTVGEISRILTRAGARAIMMENGPDRQPAAVAFVIDTSFGPRSYRLPANPVGVLKALDREYREGRVKRSQVTREHAIRVGWRIVKDWVEAQVAIIESGHAPLDQLMLPFMQVAGGETVYEAMTARQLQLGAPGPKAGG